MSKYTAEQVERVHNQLLLDGQDEDMPEVCKMLEAYAALLRERESAKAGVTELVMAEFLSAQSRYWHVCRVEGICGDNIGALRAALEAVAPLLKPSRRCWRVRGCRMGGKFQRTKATERHGFVCGSQTFASQVVRYFVDAMLAAAPKRGEG